MSDLNPVLENEPSSMDWRFLRGIPSHGRALLVYPGEPGAVLGLTANFDPVIVLLRASCVHGFHTPDPVIHVEAITDNLPFEPGSCDLVAFPDGPPKGKHALAAYRRLLSPEGVLYVGFLNRWNYTRLRRKNRLAGRCMSLRQVRQLVERAGLSVKVIYGAIPDHRVPSFLFPLQPEATHFALTSYLRTKNTVGQIGFPTALTGRLLWAMPAYCVVAGTK